MTTFILAVSCGIGVPLGAIKLLALEERRSRSLRPRRTETTIAADVGLAVAQYAARRQVDPNVTEA